MTTVFVITAKRNGFRRCGVAHSDQPTTWRQDDFTDEQWEELLKEPQLFLAVEGKNLDLGLEQRHAFTSSAALPQAPDTAQNTQSQTLEASTATLGDAVVLHIASVVGSGEPGPNSSGSGPNSPVIEQGKGQLNASDIDLDALWEEALQEDQARESDKVEAAKRPAKPGKPKAAKAEGEGK